MNYDQFERLDNKIDKILEKLEDIVQRVAVVENKASFHSRIIGWTGGTVTLVCIGIIGFLLKVTIFA